MLPDRLHLCEPRLRPLFDIYVNALELHERMLEAVVFPGVALNHLSDPDVNTNEYAELLLLVSSLANQAARLMMSGIILQQEEQTAAYEAFCNAVAHWGVPKCSST